MTVNHETLLLMANSQNDMEDWVKAIRRVIWTPFGGGIFGQHLEDTVQYEKKFGPRQAPLVVEQCVDFIREQGLNEEGLFRMPGQANLVKELQDAFDCGEKPAFDSNTDVHTVASLLKLYLRELPEPVIPFAKYEDFLMCAQLLSKDEEEGQKELAMQVKTLPQANRNLLHYICKFLDEVQAHSSENKMSVQNLATVFGPNILRPKMEDPLTIMEGTSLVQHLMTELISEHQEIFSSTESETPVPVIEMRPVHGRGTAEWITEKGLLEKRANNAPSRPDEVLSGSAISLDVNVNSPQTSSKLGSQGKGEKNSQPAISPSKRMQNLPNWKYSFKQSSGRSSSPKIGGSTLDIPHLSSSGNWLMNGLSSLRGHRRTSSEERVKETGSSQRLSTYDNVTTNPSISAQTIASATWTTSSCEISVLDSNNSCPVCNASDSPAISCSKADWSMQVAQAPSRRKTAVDLENSLDKLEVCISSISCTDRQPVVVSSSGSGGCTKALQSLVMELKTELVKQRLEYDARIQRLEESNAELRLHIHRLEEEVDQEKRKQAMLEIKLRNSERAREDAEKRNKLLQAEMEEFFATLGDLTVGTKGSKLK
ncbi:rho GTPase-activating protein 22-like isoform X2 [Protopterus annectens]|uniref:rho GTPase-activating protein 22-like isoform X2 n=1 Tax=Protopterus annectens TaxID=7888 RepID=UPI001CF9905E|nr:rho GTPase-activating protein 22-like isoform X2 [Protopterus annectens]